MKFFNKRFIISLFQIIFFLFHLDAKAYSRISKQLVRNLDRFPQDCFNFIKKNNNNEKAIFEYDRSLLKALYFHHYFAPWECPFSIISLKNLKDYLKARLIRIRKRPGWGFNKHPNSSVWVEEIISNMDLKSFPNCSKKAIIINNTDLRSLPCVIPHFTNWTSAGQGYPFDNLQISYLHAYQPIYIYHKTKNKDWTFVITNQCAAGWIKSKDVAFVNIDFIKKWKTNKYITPLNDGDSIVNKEHNKFLTVTRIGQLLPLYKENKKDFEILSCYCGKDDYAFVQISKISKKLAKRAPLILSANNIARLTNSLMNKPYGWGGLYGYRDCSEALRDIFGAFGLFLPRNSRWQKESGSKISLNRLKRKEKIKIILERGIPFLTLLYFPGHIMLYIGHKNGIPYVFNTIWGLKTKSFFRSEGRAIIGKSLIMPLNIGRGYAVIKKTPLDKLDSMILLNDNLMSPEIFESQIIESVNQLDLIEDGDSVSKIDKKILKNTKINKFIMAYGKYVDKIIKKGRRRKNRKIIFCMKNGSRIFWKDGRKKSFEEKLEKPDLNDVLFQKYKQRYPISKPRKNEDPGRFRNQEFLKSIYGKTNKEVQKNLVKVRWMPKTLKKKPIYLYFNKNAGAAAALSMVSHQLDQLPDHLKKYVTKVSGTYNWRYIKDTKRLSPHSYGIAIDINTDFSNYWIWYIKTNSNRKRLKYINRIPEEIIKIFEENNFIWGGRWYHYDTMHFEYRPEFFR